MKLKFSKAAFVGLILSICGYANAGLIDVTPDGLSFTNCGTCTTFSERGIYFLANETFTVTQVGWVGSIVSGEYELQINQGLGETSSLGALLANFSQSMTAAGNTTNFLNTDFTFLAGNEYHIDLQLSTGAAFSTGYDFLSWGNGAQQSNIGLLTLMDGTSRGAGNSWLSHFIFKTEPSAVPEPSTLAIFALGMIGLASRRFKKQS